MTLFIIVALICIVVIIVSSNKKSIQTFDESKADDGLSTEQSSKKHSLSKIMTVYISKDNPQKKRETLCYFCTSDNGYGYITVWPKDQMIPDYLEFSIAGTNYRKNLMKYTGEFKGRLEEEPTNAYDPHAIKVLAEDGHHVGYVPKDMTDRIREFMPLPCTCYCYLHRRRENGKYIFWGSAYITTTPTE